MAKVVLKLCWAVFLSFVSDEQYRPLENSGVESDTPAMKKMLILCRYRYSVIGCCGSPSFAFANNLSFCCSASQPSTLFAV